MIVSGQMNRISLYELFQKLKKEKGCKQLPRKIHLPSGGLKEIKSWKDLLLIVAESLYDDLKRLLPVVKKSGNPIVSKSGRRMREPRKLKELWIETHYSARGCLRTAIQLLKKVDRSPDEYLVEY